MRNLRGFWIGVAATVLTTGAVLAIQFARIAGSTGSIAQATATAIGVVLAVALAWAIGYGGLVAAGGWSRRRRLLLQLQPWPVLVAATRDEPLTLELQRAREWNRLGRRNIPWGLTLTADAHGLGLWSDRSGRLDAEMWVPWTWVWDIQPTVSASGLDRSRAIGIAADYLGVRVDVAVPIRGGFPLDTGLASPESILHLVDDLNRLRSVAAR